MKLLKFKKNYFHLFYENKKIEGLNDYFELLDANVLGQNEISRDIPAPKQHDVLTVVIFKSLEPKKSDALSPKKIDSLA